jgi:hypothetical protein
MAILFNASDIHLRSGKTMGLQSQTPFSMVVWIKATWNPGSRRALAGIYGPATDTPLATPVTAVQIGTTSGNGELSFWTWGGGILTGTGAGVMTPFNGVWVMTTYTFDGTTHRGYYNATLASSATTAQVAGYLNQVYLNGYPSGGTNQVHNHQIGWYALYRRTLSAAEIATIYYASGTGHGIVDGLICQYNFDNGVEGATVASQPDLTGHGHTLTSVGAGSPITYTYLSTVATSNLRPVQ